MTNEPRSRVRKPCPFCGEWHAGGFAGCENLPQPTLTGGSDFPSDSRSGGLRTQVAKDGATRDSSPADSQPPHNATPDRAAEHYPGEPAPVEMVRDLQRALFGASYASHRSPADEWAHLIECVKSAVPRAPWDNR